MVLKVEVKYAIKLTLTSAFLAITSLILAMHSEKKVAVYIEKRLYHVGLQINPIKLLLLKRRKIFFALISVTY